MSWFRDLLRELGAREHRSIQLLRDQVTNAADAVRTVRASVSGDLDSADAERQVIEIEHRGDAARAELARVLAAAVAPPLDREDLYRVSRSVDDVLDNLRDFAREFALFDACDDGIFAETLGAIGTAVDRLGEAIDQLAVAPERLADTVAGSKKASTAIRRRYQEAVAALLVGPVDVVMLRRRELLRRLDVVGLRLGEAADALADGGVKRHP